mgnify:CR=1 FL=1
MKRNKNRIFLLLLTVMLVIGVWSGSALAVTAVDPSDTLLISIKIGEKTTDLHTYDKSELEALAKGQNVSYSSIDNMPATVKTVASGVYVEDLLNNIQKYTNIDVWKFSKLRFTSTDGAKGIFTYDDLFAHVHLHAGWDSNSGRQKDHHK